MRRIGTFGWILIAAVVATLALNVVAPAVGIYAAVVLALLVLAAAAEGMGGLGGPNEMVFDQTVNERKRETLSRRYRRGRPGWEATAPDHAGEPPELIWERERRRRGLR